MQNGPIKIAMCSIAAPPGHEEGNLSFPNKHAYCVEHGYGFYWSYESLCPQRHPSWSKILMLLGYLKEHDYLFWTDADSVIANPKIKIESIIGDSDADLFIALDAVGINAGQFIIRNTPAVERFLAAVWEEYPPGGDWWEQSAMINLIDSGRADIKINFVEKRLLNCYPGEYRPGDFIIHWPGDPGRVPKMAARLNAIEKGIGGCK